MRLALVIERMAHRRLAHVRDLYRQKCGYCGVSEVDSGGELTVDHFRPTSAGGNDSDDNLVYACFRCNVLKSNYWHGDSENEAPFRVLHPLRDDMSRHMSIDPLSGELEALTATGRFHVALLDLNRPQLLAHRQREGIRKLYDEIRDSSTTELTDLRAEILAYERYVDRLERLLNIQSD